MEQDMTNDHAGFAETQSQKENERMTTNVMIDRIAEPSPRFIARMTGLFFLFTILGGIFSQGFVAGRLIAFGDAPRTAANILAHKSLFQWGFTVYLVEMTCQITFTMLFYALLKPVNRNLARVSTALALAGCVIKTMSRLFFIAPLLVLEGPHYSTAFTVEQSHALSLLFLELNDMGAAIALAFFGSSTLLKGILMVKATFFPRILGVLSIAGGLGFLTYLSPPVGYSVFPYVAAVGLLGAIASIGWLLTRGVNEERWNAQARVAAASIWR